MAVVSEVGQNGENAAVGVLGALDALGRGHEASSAMLGEFGKERGPPLLERCELGPELLQLAVDALRSAPAVP